MTRRDRRTWRFLFAFLLGAMLAEFTADPISDYLFFKKSQEPFEGEEAIIYWYYIPAMVYATLFVFTYLLYRAGRVSPNTIIVMIIVIAVYSTYLSVKIFSGSTLSIVLLVIPVILLSYILLRGERSVKV